MHETLAKRALGPLVILIGLYMVDVRDLVMAHDSLAYENEKAETFLFIADKEGGYANDPKDRGGETNYGITSETLNNLKGKDEYYNQFKSVKDITPKIAQQIYNDEFLVFNEINYGKNAVALKMTEIAINTGGPRATMLMQRSLNRLFKAVILKDDGKQGSNTAKAYEEAIYEFGPDAIVDALIFEQKLYYQDIVNFDDSQDKFLDGWMDRANFRPTVLR
jgi:lysozyme family protein